ncbi:MAG: hypothetical protein IIW93_00695 [Bacteroidaceae bacterium]|nr:hypothetical protein [Bacteroidaceae bacterium]
MKRYFLHIILGGLLASSFTACQQDVPNVEQTDEVSRRIYLSARVNEATKVTRAPYDPPQTDNVCLPTNEKPLDVSVWATTFPNSFKHIIEDGEPLDGSRDNRVAIHTSAHFQSGEPQLLGEAIYPTPTEGNNVEVDFVGLHPQSDQWTTNDDGSHATFKFSGNEDVMFAPKITGEYGLDYEENSALVPTFHFYHLLTWLRISIVAYLGEDEENSTTLTEDDKKLKREKVSNAWGKIKSLTITSKDQITIHNLGTTGYKVVDGTPQIDKNEFTNEEKVSFTNSDTNAETLNLYCHNTDDQFPITGKDDDNTVPNEFKGVIPTSVTPTAYVMCAPIVGATQDVLGNPVPEYTLHIRTEHREMDIPLDLKGDEGNPFTGSTMGKVFNIQLRFKMGDVISVSTEISVGGDADWFTHGTGTGDITEGDLE